MNFIIDPQLGPHIRDYSDQSQDWVVICSNSSWWAAKGCSYTTRDMAGVYTRDDAYKRAGHCGPEKGCCFYDVPADHVPKLQAEVERLREALIVVIRNTHAHRDLSFADTCWHEASAALAAQPRKGSQQ